MGKFGILIAGMAAAACFAGCTIIRELPADERKEQPQGPEFELCRTQIKAFMRNDAGTFVANVPDEARRTFNEKFFEASRKSVIESMGEPISFQYVTALKLTDNITPHIWKIRFKRVNRKGAEFTSELLFKIVIGMLKDKPVMISFQFL